MPNNCLCQFFVGQIFALPTWTGLRECSVSPEFPTRLCDAWFIALMLRQLLSNCATTQCIRLFKRLPPHWHFSNTLPTVPPLLSRSIVYLPLSRSISIFVSPSVSWRSRSAVGSRILCANSTPNGAASAAVAFILFLCRRRSRYAAYRVGGCTQPHLSLHRPYAPFYCLPFTRDLYLAMFLDFLLRTCWKGTSIFMWGLLWLNDPKSHIV